MSVLEIYDVTIEDAGEYVCTATNEYGQVYCSALLTVEGNLCMMIGLRGFQTMGRGPFWDPTK